MKRLHVHVAVKNVEASIRFYSQLFAAEPSVRKPDYAKWMLEDPRVNFAISLRTDRGVTPGVDHLGIQVEDRAELQDVYGRLKNAEAPVIEERRDDLLLCAKREELDPGPAGSAVGDLSNHGRKHRLRD